FFSPSGPRPPAPRAPRRFGEQLAPDLVALNGGLHVARFGLVAAIGHDGGNAHSEANREGRAGRHVVFRLFLTEDDALHRRARDSAHALRPGDARITL